MSRTRGRNAQQEEQDERMLPPRSRVHPSKKIKWTRLFYKAQVVLYVMLIVALIGWFLWERRPT